MYDYILVYKWDFDQHDFALCIEYVSVDLFALINFN